MSPDLSSELDCQVSKLFGDGLYKTTLFMVLPLFACFLPFVIFSSQSGPTDIQSNLPLYIIEVIVVIFIAIGIQLWIRHGLIKQKLMVAQHNVKSMGITWIEASFTLERIQYDAYVYDLSNFVPQATIVSMPMPNESPINGITQSSMAYSPFTQMFASS
jgi:Zn-dependent protease with chaperone function